MKQQSGAFSYLRDAAWRAFHMFCCNGLDGVYHHQFRLDGLDLLENQFQRGFAQDDHMVTFGFGQSFSTHLQLVCTLLSADVKHPLVCHLEDGLQRQRTLSNAWLAAQKGDGARNKSASQHAVQLVIVHVDARFVKC